MFPQIILPSFHGFYESIWSTMADDEYEYIAQEHHVTEIDGWEQVNREQFEQDICERYANFAIDEMNFALGLHLLQGVVQIWSPREYNFTTDKIYVVVELSDADRERIVHLMLSDYNRLKEVIHQEHTSRDGFISFMSNDIDEWLNIIRMGSTEDFGLYLGYALYYLWNPSTDFDYDAYEWICGNVCAEVEPYTEKAKKEWEKVQIAEEYLGWGGYDPDRMAHWSAEGLKFRLEKEKWEREHLLTLALAQNLQ